VRGGTVRIVDFQIGVTFASPEIAKPQNFAIFPTAEFIRHKVREGKIEAPFRKVAFSLIQSRKDFGVSNALNILHIICPYAIGETVNYAKLKQIVLEGMDKARQLVGINFEALRDLILDNFHVPPTRLPIPDLSKKFSSVLVETWLTLDVGRSSIQTTIKTKAGEVTTIDVMSLNRPLYLEDDFPYKGVRIEDSELVFYNKQTQLEKRVTFA
jgi:hypothetical protein